MGTDNSEMVLLDENSVRDSTEITIDNSTEIPNLNNFNEINNYWKKIVINRDYNEIKKLLEMDNCDPNWFINEDKITALHLFVINDDIKLIELLFTSSKIHVNSRDWLLRIPLHYSCQNGNLKSVRILMKRGANPRALAWETEEKDKLSIPYNWSPFPLQTEIGLILFPKEKEKEYKLSDIFMLILILFIIFK